MEFNVADSLGSLPADAIAQYLDDIGDHARAQALTASAVQGQNILRPDAPFNITSSQIGFVQPAAEGDFAPLVGAAQLEADPTLIGTQIKISFNAAYIHEYPGVGVHSILCEFVGKNQIKDETEALRMALRFQSRDKANVSVLGAPIFLGLTVGPNGIAFEGRSINVSSTSDELLLEVLDTSAFKSGLALVNSVQPGLKPFVGLMQSAVKMVAKRARNRQVHNFSLGLDFEANSTSSRLRHGSYVVAQAKATDWNWSDFEWDVGSMALRRTLASGGGLIDFNYMVVGVAPYTPAVAAKPARGSARS